MNYGYSDSIPADDPRQSGWSEQRASLGFDDTELWNLDETIAAFVAPRLRRFREVSKGSPNGLTPAQWDEILGKMIEAFEVDGPYHEQREGLELFAKYFHALWD